MMTPRNSRLLRAIPVLITICLVSFPAHAKYGGGTGEPNDPYQIATAADLIALGEDPNDYDKHFLLTADIDLSAFDGKEGRPAFNIIGDSYEHYMAYGAGGVRLSGTPFTGVFDGNGHTISHLTAVNAQNTCRGLFGGLASSGQILNIGVVDINVTSSDGPVGGLVAYNHGTVTRCYSTGTVIGASDVGGLVGSNIGSIIASYSTGTVSGTGENVGGLVGSNREEIVWSWLPLGGDFCQGRVLSAYSAGSVSGRRAVGGLVGDNSGGDVTQCYSTGLVSGTEDVGGLVGYNWGTVSVSFWDTQTSGQTASAGGRCLTTAEMQTASTFSKAGWGACDGNEIWTIDEGKDYPRLAWENKPGEAIEPILLPDFLSGVGTQDDPYLIYTPEELNLAGLGPCDWDKHFKLMADINLSGLSYDRALIAPDADPGDAQSEFQGTSFTGVFDGNNHTISHLTITGQGYLGLFGQLAADGKVNNLGLVDVNIAGSGSCVGALVGTNGTWNTDGGTVTHCYSTGAVSGGSTVGGLVGYNGSDGDVTQCYSGGLVSSTGDYVGGLVGSNREHGTLTQCCSSGAVIGDDLVGGLVGSSDGTMTQCYSTSLVSGSVGSAWGGVGGLVGLNGGTVTQCYSAGSVSGTGQYSFVGGLVGAGSRSRATASFWDTQTSGQTTSAGGTGKTTAEMQTAGTFLDAGWDFVGETTNGTEDIWRIDEGKDYPRLWWQNLAGEPIPEPCPWAGSGTKDSPYLIYTAEEFDMVGLSWASWHKHFRLMADVDLSSFDGREGRPPFNIIAPDALTRVPGLQGIRFSGVFDGNGHTVKNFYYMSQNSEDTCIGLFGCIDGPNAEIKNLGLFEPNVSAPGGERVASLVGFLKNGSLSNCYVEGGHVMGSWSVGGVAGWNAGAIMNCWSAATVSGSYVGGLVAGNEGTIMNCYSTGLVSSLWGSGGLVSGSKGSIVASFWDTQTSGQSTSAGGTSKTTAKMQIASTFLGAGWDFVGETANGTEDIWRILEGQDYPRLWWETAGQ